MSLLKTQSCPNCGSQNIKIIVKDLIKRLLTTGELMDKVTKPNRRLGVCLDCKHMWVD